MSPSFKLLTFAVGGLGASSVALVYSMESKVQAMLQPGQAQWPKYPWSHSGLGASFDSASVRRGFEVYSNVCRACHGVRAMYYRRLINFTHTKQELEAEIADVMVLDGPNDEGKMFERPAAVTDKVPDPYPNAKAAAYANNGAAPPDLSPIVFGRNGGEDYIFSLLTGYQEAPVGVQLMSGQHFNAYFPGNVISMPPPLYNGAMEYSDGTPATASQMAKDVTAFLAWTSDPTLNERQMYGPRILFVMGLLTAWGYYFKRLNWSSIFTVKTRFVKWGPVNKKSKGPK